MTLPDVSTLDQLCDEKHASACTDGTCDGCKIMDTMANTPGIQRFIERVMDDIEREPSNLPLLLLSCLTAGFGLGMEFERQRRRRLN